MGVEMEAENEPTLKDQLKAMIKSAMAEAEELNYNPREKVWFANEVTEALILIENQLPPF